MAQGNKHALIIAIGDYPDQSGWEDLSSANDIPLIRTILEMNDFPEENILILQDSEATKEDIVEAVNLFAERLEPGDVFYFLHRRKKVGGRRK